MIPTLPRPSPIRIRYAFILLLALFGFDAVLGALVTGLAAAFGMPRADALALVKSTPVELLAYVGGAGAAVWLGWRTAGLGWRALCPHRTDPRLYAASAMLVAGASTLISELTNLITGLLPLPQWMLKTTVEAGDFTLFQQVLLTVVAAPVCEELLCRGVILRRLHAGIGPTRALLVSALVFGLAHFFPLQVLATFLIGLVLGWMFLRSSALTIPMVGHAINNGLVTAMDASGIQVPGINAPPVSGVLQLQPWWLDGLGLVLTVAGIVIFRRLTPPPPGPAPEPPPLPAAGSPAAPTTTVA